MGETNTGTLFLANVNGLADLKVDATSPEHAVTLATEWVINNPWHGIDPLFDFGVEVIPLPPEEVRCIRAAGSINGNRVRPSNDYRQYPLPVKEEPVSQVDGSQTHLFEMDRYGKVSDILEYDRTQKGNAVVRALRFCRRSILVRI